MPAGSSNYIQANPAAQQAGASFNISGTGTANILNATTQFNLGGFRVLSSPVNNNLFAGLGAGQANTTGQDNAFFGSVAGLVNTKGINNTIFGYAANVALSIHSSARLPVLRTNRLGELIFLEILGGQKRETAGSAS